MAPLWSYQPFKALYLLSAAVGTPLFAILLSIRYILRSQRPHREWPLSSSVIIRISRIALRIIGATRFRTPVLRPPGKGAGYFVSIPPTDAAHYSSLPQNPAVTPAPVNALWFPGPWSDNNPDERVVLQIPGGAFVMAFPAHSTGQQVAGVMSRTLGARVLYAQYRLAHDEASRFPAALQDVITAYAYLIAQGVPPRNIILSGDSAGGNLVLALVRYLSSGASGLPAPKGAIAWSPWVDVTPVEAQRLARNRNYATDTLPMVLMHWGIEAYPPKDDAKAMELVSFAGSPFQTGVPVAIHAGALELLRDQIQSFAKEMAQVNKGAVQYRETGDGIHDLLLTHETWGGVEAIDTFIKEAAEFFDESQH